MGNPATAVDTSHGSAPLHPHHWLPGLLRRWRFRVRARIRLLGSAVFLGVVVGLAAALFFLVSQGVVSTAQHAVIGYTAEGAHPWQLPRNPVFRPWLFALVPLLGGLLSGLLVYQLAPEAAGGGTDAIISCYSQPGPVRPRVPFVKILASALTVGTGGSGGKEGPMAQIGGSCGSLLGSLFGLRPSERRILLAAGMGAGVSAIFHAPVAGALFAAEMLYHSPEFEPEVILPTSIASVVSACTFSAFFGWRPVMTAPALAFTSSWELCVYLLLALFLVVLAMLYTRTFHGFSHLFDLLPIPRCMKPAIGALLSGLLGLGLYFSFGKDEQVLAVLSFGQGVLQEGLTQDTDLAPSSIGVLLAMALGKIVTTGLTAGSGGAGGLFGPALVVGGCGGGALALGLNQLAPGLIAHPASFILVGMAGCFAAASRTLFSTVVIVSELTGGYQLLLPLLWVCSLAFLLSDDHPICHPIN